MWIYIIMENTEFIGFFMFDCSFYSNILDPWKPKILVHLKK